MIRTRVRSDLREVALEVRTISPEARKAAVRALNRAATSVRAEASREVRKVYLLPAREVKEQIALKRASLSELRAELVATGRPIPLARFSAKKSRTGAVTVKIKRGEPRKIVRGKPQYAGSPFLVTLKTGHEGIFQRVGKARLPIKELFSVDIASAMITDRIWRILRDRARQVFESEYARSLAFFSRRKNG